MKIKIFNQLRIKQTMMLTGDNQTISQKIANHLGLDHYQADLKPYLLFVVHKY